MSELKVEEVQQRRGELIEQPPHAETHDVVDAPAEAGCCGGRDEVEAGDHAEVVSSASGGCCGGNATSAAGAPGVAAPAAPSCCQ